MAQLIYGNTRPEFGSIGDIQSESKTNIDNPDVSGETLNLYDFLFSDLPETKSKYLPALLKGNYQNPVGIIIQSGAFIASDEDLSAEDELDHNLISLIAGFESAISEVKRSTDAESVIDRLKFTLVDLNRNPVYKEYPKASERALKNALKSVTIIKDQDLKPLKPQRTYDGGIMIEFPKPQKITFIEFENDGEILLGYIDENNEESYLETDIDHLGLHLETYEGEIDQ